MKGYVVGSGDPINLVNVYAPQSTAAKLSLWNELAGIIDPSVGLWVLSGDFNAVRSSDERKNSNFKPACAENFNNFIFSSDLHEYPMQGRKFTCIRDNGKKLSKLDRFLVCSDFFIKWPSACVRVLASQFSDHCPILLELVDLKFGPKPFRVYNSWIGKPGYEDAVKEALVGFDSFDPSDSCLTAKFARIRAQLKIWRDKFLAKESELEKTALAELETLESDMENRELSEDEEWSLVENKNLIKETEIRRNLDIKQRARLRWAVDGDENSKFFHALVNNRKIVNAIHGLSIDGVWCTKSAKIKHKVLSFFRDRFKEPASVRPDLLLSWY
ncbi:uncharacterized protein LOC110887361 [Helianthus annuus]|uniref:uncharacterized protein LOC110887361 n=1 Tax=Helianthus annuus TaxID=4232 RepID=UPI000B8F7132|nr:uncharacterized protein LOC110887361 [Helianthus annuus]